MTRDKAKALLGSTALLMFEHNGSSTLDGDKTLHIIDKIFDEHGEHLMDRDDEIELLKCRIEEAMKPKTCEGCKHIKGIKPKLGQTYCAIGIEDLNYDLGVRKDFCCNKWEQKDNA